MAHTPREVMITGPVLALARIQDADVEAVHAFASDPVVCRFTGWGPNTFDETRAFVAEATQRRIDRYDLAILRDGELIGTASVWTTSPGHRVGELGNTIRRDCWGRGYASEAARLLVGLGFGQLRAGAAGCDVRPWERGFGAGLAEGGPSTRRAPPGSLSRSRSTSRPPHVRLPEGRFLGGPVMEREHVRAAALGC